MEEQEDGTLRGRLEPASSRTPTELEKVHARYSAPRIGRAGDGKRIRRANRTGSVHTEIATLVEHNTGLASISFEGGEIAAVRALLETVDVSGRVALHTTRDTARIIVETPDYLLQGQLA